MVGLAQPGLAHLDRTTNSWSHLRHDPGDPESLPSDFITFVHRDRQGRVWVGGTAGLALYLGDGKFTVFKPLPELGEVEPNYLVCMTEDHRGSSLDRGRRRDCTGSIRSPGPSNTTSMTPTSPTSPVLGPVLSIHCDRSGIIWAGSWHTGLNKYDPGSSKFEVTGTTRTTPSLDDSAIGSVFEDSRRVLWVGGARTPSGRVAPSTANGPTERIRPDPFSRYRGIKVQSVYCMVEDRRATCCWAPTSGSGNTTRQTTVGPAGRFLDGALLAGPQWSVLALDLDPAGRLWVNLAWPESTATIS